MHPFYSKVSLVVANLLMPISLMVFATGFFPHKPFLPGLARYQQLPNREPPEARFDRIIFMVVDALRSDFVYSNHSGFTYTQSLIRTGAAIPFTSHAQAPTVTMPRVKALTTGSIPSFLDMILNIAESDTTSTLAHQDTWITQMAEKHAGKLVMYGDDTWLKLFPNTFDRVDGTVSFFVSDFTEVDYNVTRHVPSELQRDDWSVIIMHYLGMDHIGHKSGSASVNMIPKQREMDNVVQEIYDSFTSDSYLRDSLLLLCGDHGMTNGGNHGGSAPGETSPAMLFISPKFKSSALDLSSPILPGKEFEYYNVIEQSDVAPTLAGLLGFPIPLNNLGVFIPNMLSQWQNEDDQIQLLFRNALQLLNVVKVTFPHPYYVSEKTNMACDGSLSTSDELACLWKGVHEALHRNPQNLWTVAKCKQPLLNFCYKAQSNLSSIASNYHAGRLYIGIALALSAVVLAFSAFVPKPQLRTFSASTFTITSAVAYLVMMFASSFVEEEQQFWYWASTAWATLSWSHTSVIFHFVLMLAMRLLRRWNQSGQKYAGSPDIALFLRSYPSWLAFLVSATYGAMVHDLRSTLPGRAATLETVAIISATAIFKLIFTFNDAPELFGSTISDIGRLASHLPGLVVLSRVVFILCVLYLLTLYPFQQKGFIEKRRLRQALLALLTVFLSNQIRAINIPTLLFWRSICASLNSRSWLSEGELSLWTLLMAHVSFFALGGTNGISSIDLSNAYNGVSSYNPIPVGLLLFVSNWAGPIYWSIFGTITSLDLAEVGGTPEVELSTPTSSSTQARLTADPFAAWRRHIGRLTYFMAMAVLGVELACCVLREHLFVWTVFSPKLLYVGAWLMGWHICVNIVLGGAVTFIWG